MGAATVVHAATKGKPRAPRTTEKADLMDGVDGAMPHGQDLALILASLQTMRNGDFTVRLPVAWTGLKGKIANTFNDIVSTNERIAMELHRVGRAVGKEGRTRERTRFQVSRGVWGEMEGSVNTLVKDWLRNHRDDARDCRRGLGKPNPNGAAGRGRKAARR